VWNNEIFMSEENQTATIVSTGAHQEHPAAWGQIFSQPVVSSTNGTEQDITSITAPDAAAQERLTKRGQQVIERLCRGLSRLTDFDKMVLATTARLLESAFLEGFDLGLQERGLEAKHKPAAPSIEQVRAASAATVASWPSR
jgi:hypothetical protein